MAEAKKRNINFEVLRILATFMVISIHTTGYHWYECIPGSFDFFIYTFFNCFGRCSVPLFFMISGAFLLQKEVSLKYLFKKIAELLLIYFVWLAGYAIFEVEGSLLQFDIRSWLNCMLNEKYHLWFIPVMACVYLLVPVLYALVHYKDGHYVPYLITIFFITGICRSTVLALFVEVPAITTFLEKINVQLCDYTGYFILGYYLYSLSKRKIKRTTATILFMINLAIATITVFCFSYYNGVITNVFYSNFVAPIFFQAVFLFILFRDSTHIFKNQPKLQNFCLYVGSLCRGIYLLHIFIIEHLDGWFGINSKMFTAVLALPLATIIYFVVTTVIVALMRKIPIVKQLF